LNNSQKLVNITSHPLIFLVRSLAEKLELDVYLVGGPLRDLILKREVKDFDFAIDGDWQKFAHKLFLTLRTSYRARIIYYPKFMTATIFLRREERNGKNKFLFPFHIDIARTRKEIYEKPAQLPKVAPASIAEDLKRRDFTINAIAYDLKRKRLFDPLDGKKDIKRKIIRVIHERSFIDDPTRIFRAIRFAVRFNFRIEKKTGNWLLSAIKGDYIARLSGERFLNELRIIMKEERWLTMIKKLQKIGVFQSYFQKSLPNQHLKDLAKIRLFPETSLLLLYLLSPFDTTRLPLTRLEQKTIADLRRISFLKKQLVRAKKPSTQYIILKDFTPASLQLIKELVPKTLNKKIEDYLHSYRQVKVSLTGHDLKRLGIKPKVRYGELLKELLYQRLDGKIKSKREEINYLRQSATEVHNQRLR